VKYVLFSIFLVLCLATAIDHFSRSTVQSKVPILYWVTNINSSRVEQVKLFHEWLQEKGYPEFELRLDSTNFDASKKLIQGVSGVGADIISMARDEAWLFHATGMLEDLRPYAEKHGFTLDKTWAAAAPSFMIDGEQVGFPRAISLQTYFLNVKLFEKYGVPLPSLHWTVDEFTQTAKAFVKAANQGKDPRDRIFFCDIVNVATLRRGMGRSVMNETMTRCTLDNPESIRLIKLIHQWTYEDRIIPTQADLDFFAGSDTNTSRTQLFVRDRYALLTGARYSLVQLRDHPLLKMEVRMTPYETFPNTLMGTGSVGIYKNSKHKELAAYLLEFFASAKFNMNVVRTADAIPPIPFYTTTEEYQRPADYPLEWQIHQETADLLEYAITPEASPFILPTALNRIESEYRLATLAGIYTPEEGMARAEDAVNREMDQNVSADPQLKARYFKLMKDQQTIERLRAAGELVPAHLITNPFYQRYYRERGWSTDA
jgi:multiple sugar transport system substrate-binding protein